MSTTTGRAAVRLALAEDPLSKPEPAPWIGPLLALGARASRFASTHTGRQLVIAVSVPQRDFAAVLVACGWVMARAAPESRPAIEVMRELVPGTHVRVVTAHEVILDRFTRFDESVTPARLYLAGSVWLGARIHAIEAVKTATEVELPARMPRPFLGGLGQLAHLNESWNARLAAPDADLAIVGTRAWLHEDFQAFLSGDGVDALRSKVLLDDATKAHEKGKPYKVGFGHGSLLDVVLPETPRSATAFSKVYPSSRFAENLPLPPELRAVILDGNGAIKYVAEIEAPVVICILDRSVADETAGELIVQMRNTRGAPVSIRQGLGWCAPAGVEALAFTVAL